MTDSAQQQIDQVVKGNDVVLFMKGSPDFPQCGFSQRVTAILNEYGVPYAAVNVLLSDAIRQGIKAYSDWPTIPQLYIKAEFIGGCDIISEMHASGELKELLAPLQKDA
ncbi:MAG: monothiol glutaredoxin, Grx4 family [Zetaproteobacteria bacterium CG12_big_fil_rev_8_21_14_0_65_54_13]|nr:MAG: monothiol glutaredoxin, Grx4 family [Zetaproteobacteria bacterium CG23_combo_of_CG06-09_8_20_14_all_54_7]PIW45808.1 MAG: monothiol glutaredoxin, Grx4 family [Zetaproteobacteria bacterium CG12_big_fil_rev_8_21_14_0_65_54_13]PIX54176.1 MAG: monothiol glutaredoxin, Grx4 family [Zetaproteobacteria bacterium CG_4_10_14_3_um_filter_54_28]PJA27009.1 MAG: monothiol glutaredoxin, Grx4 family [Zetaproteobacteria bacterium CG_4_9_14_3_um_filter_54_145]